MALEVITRFKPNVILEPTAVVARLLAAVDRVAENSDFDITVICGSEDHHITDPHTLGRALDLHSLLFTDAEKRDIMRAILWELADEPPEDVSSRMGKWLALETDEWAMWVEDHDGESEHFTVQRRKGALPLD